MDEKFIGRADAKPFESTVAIYFAETHAHREPEERLRRSPGKVPCLFDAARTALEAIAPGIGAGLGRNGRGIAEFFCGQDLSVTFGCIQFPIDFSDIIHSRFAFAIPGDRFNLCLMTGTPARRAWRSGAAQSQGAFR